MTRLRYALKGSVYSIDLDGDGVLEHDVRQLEHGDINNYTNRPPADMIPSMGDEYESCGQDWANFCTGHECGEVHSVGKSCGRSLCPRDYAKWGVERATTACAKMEETRKEIYFERNERKSPKFHHVVASMGNIRFAREDAEKAMFELMKYLFSKALGVDGGVMYYHSYRGKDGDDRGVWKNRIGRETSWDDVREELKHSEHVHAMVLADKVDYYSCEAIEQATAIPIHRIERAPNDDNDHVSLYGLSDLARATTYSLSHTNVKLNEDGSSRVSSRYFGRVAQTAAGTQTEAQSNAKVREVANTTLGISFKDLSCTRELEDGEERHQHSASDTRSSGTTTSESAEKDEEHVCGGRLVDISKAPRFLNDDNWCKNAKHANEVRETWERLVKHPPPD